MRTISRASRSALVVLLLCGPLWMPASAAGEADAEPEYEMTTYQFALLRRGPEQQPLGEREIVRLQQGHLAHLAELLDKGKVVIAGPLDGGGEIHSVVVLDVGSVDAAEAILRQDPWIRAGRLTPEVHSWWAAEGILQRPESHLHTTTCYLALLERPPGAPEYPEEKLLEIQSGHLANIRSMADSGDLVIAGPMGGDGALRGVFVFRSTDPDRLRRLVARDPAVKAGRLGVTLYPWNVPRGSLPGP